MEAGNRFGLNWSETVVCIHPAATNWVSFERRQNPKPSCQQIQGRNSAALLFPRAIGFQDGDSPLQNSAYALTRARDGLEWRSLLQTTFCALDASLKTSYNFLNGIRMDLRLCDQFTSRTLLVSVKSCSCATFQPMTGQYHPWPQSILSSVNTLWCL